MFKDVGTITQAELKSILNYDSDTGIFRWRNSGKGKPAHGIAGTPNNFGYMIICIHYRRYLAHRLAWVYSFGVWPKNELDHIDRDPKNNRLHNLRECDHSQNHCNIGIRADNTSGFPGVCWDKQKLKWKVQISIKNGKRLQKHFINFDDAVFFYKETALRLFGEFTAKSVVCDPRRELTLEDL